LLAFGLGLAAALLIYALLHSHSGSAARRARRSAPSSPPPAASTRPSAFLAQARLADGGRPRPGVRRELAAALYRPDAALDLDATDRALARALDGRGR
jgi:hypothetical protein